MTGVMQMRVQRRLRIGVVCAWREKWLPKRPQPKAGPGDIAEQTEDDEEQEERNSPPS